MMPLEPLGPGCWMTCAKPLYLSQCGQGSCHLQPKSLIQELNENRGDQHPYQFLITFSQAKLCPALLSTQSQPTKPGISHRDKLRTPIFPISGISVLTYQVQSSLRIPFWRWIWKNDLKTSNHPRSLARYKVMVAS